MNKFEMSKFTQFISFTQSKCKLVFLFFIAAYFSKYASHVFLRS